MTTEEFVGISVGFVTVAGALVAVVRWLDKGALVQDIKSLKEGQKRIDTDISSLRQELKVNNDNDVNLEKRVIRIESQNEAQVNMLEKIDSNVSKIFTLLSDNNKEAAKLGERVAKLER